MRTTTDNRNSAAGPRPASGVIHVQKPRMPASAVFYRPDIDDPVSIILVSLIVVLILGAFLMSSSAFEHWFLIPVGMCGVLTGIDGIAWIRRRVDLYDLVGILGLFGFHFFFLAPLLHVEWDLWMPDVSPPPDWRDWLGYMALLNVAGLIAYRICRNLFNRRRFATRPKSFWKIDRQLFRIVTPTCLAIAAALQILVYARMGGISGYMQTLQDNPSAMEGMGWVFMISESVGVLAMFLVIVHFQNGKMNWSKAVGVLFGLFALEFLFAGLRGSRSQSMQFLFWLVGCVHFLVRPVPRRFIYVGSIFVMAFLYFYTFYKAGGAAGVSQALSGSAARQQISRKSGHTFRGVILGDLGRSDVQAFVLYRVMDSHSDYHYALGRTYLGSVAILIPHFILKERPESKLKWGTDIQSGTGHYFAKKWWSSRVYALAGEAMLNFGPIAVPIVYGLFGLLVGWLRASINRLPAGDARFLMVPLVVYTCFATVISDSDNLLFGIVKNGFVPGLVLVVCSVRRKLSVPHSVPQFAPAPAPPVAHPVYARRTSLPRNTWKRV
jgi:hypothetical protein